VSLKPQEAIYGKTVNGERLQPDIEERPEPIYKPWGSGPKPRVRGIYFYSVSLQAPQIPAIDLL